MGHALRGAVACVILRQVPIVRRVPIARKLAVARAVAVAAAVAAALIAPRAARAEPSDLAALRELKLVDVVAVAVRQSPDLARARIDLDTARAQLTRAEGVEDVHLGAQADANAQFAAASDPAGADFDAEGVTLSVSRALPTGGTLSLEARGDRSRQLANALINGMPTATVLRRYESGLALRLVQPLLRGAGPTAFQAPIRQAEHQRDAAALTGEARARDTVVALAQAYWQVAFAWRQLEVRKVSLELADKQLAYTEGAIRSEKVPRSELLAVQQAIATRKQDVLAGEQELYERSLALRQLAGLEIGPDAIAVRTEALPAKIAPDDPALDGVIRAAFARSAELAALAASRRAAEAAEAAADNAARSRIDLDISAGPVGADGTASGALSSAVESPGFKIAGGLTADHAIGQRVERGGQAVAHAAVFAAKLAERDAQAKLAVRATRAVQRARAASASVALGDQAIGLAEQNVTAEQKRFELGKSTNFDVLRRQDELEQARLRQAAAVADYLAARADLDGLSGEILARYHIAMPAK